MPVQQSRWRSKAVWTALITHVLAILVLVGAFEKLGIEEATVKGVVFLILEIPTVLGFFNNPTVKNRF